MDGDTCFAVSNRQHRTRQDYNDFFTIRVAEMVHLVSRVFRSAANILAQFNIKTPDAIHLAAAVDAHCDVFLTNDLKLKRLSPLKWSVSEFERVTPMVKFKSVTEMVREMSGDKAVADEFEKRIAAPRRSQSAMENSVAMAGVMD